MGCSPENPAASRSPDRHRWQAPPDPRLKPRKNTHFHLLKDASHTLRMEQPRPLDGSKVQTLGFLRKACQMNGKEFAEALHCDNAVLSRWENGGGFGAVTERTIRNTVWGILYRKVPAIQIEPGHFERMKIFSLPEGSEISRLTLERVRLKDRTLQRKTDEWDIAA